VPAHTDKSCSPPDFFPPGNEDIFFFFFHCFFSLIAVSAFFLTPRLCLLFLLSWGAGGPLRGLLFFWLGPLPLLKKTPPVHPSFLPFNSLLRSLSTLPTGPHESPFFSRQAPFFPYFFFGVRDVLGSELWIVVWALRLPVSRDVVRDLRQVNG